MATKTPGGIWSTDLRRPCVSAARSASANEDAAEDLAQSIWAGLYGLRARKDGRPPASSLITPAVAHSPVRAVVAQLAVDEFANNRDWCKQRRRRISTGLLATRRSERVTRCSPECQHPRKRCRIDFTQNDMQRALSQSVQELTAEDRLLVKLYYFDNLRLREAGAVLGVHEATASRRLTRIQTDLRKRVTKSVIDERGWTWLKLRNDFQR